MQDSEIILSTYNNPNSLRASLASLQWQTAEPASICVADDGSGPETAAVIKAFRDHSRVPVRHVWHEDDGFRKSEILNKAVVTSTAEYVVFADGDEVLHPDFLARHIEARAAGRFLVGGMIRLNEPASRKLESATDIPTSAFAPAWLKANSERFRWTDHLKTRPWPKFLMVILEKLLVPPRRSLGGCNCSMFRADFLAVNGYDEGLVYGGQDKELGERLKNAGLRAKSVRYTTPALHLFHGRPYDNRSGRTANRDQINKTRKDKLNWTERGIIKGPRPAR